jgi:hypothetical protein
MYVEYFKKRHTKSAGIYDLFDVVIVAAEVPRGKPAPDVYLKAAELIGANPTKCRAYEVQLYTYIYVCMCSVYLCCSTPSPSPVHNALPVFMCMHLLKRILKWACYQRGEQAWK